MVNCEDLLAVHRCLGRAGDPEVIEFLKPRGVVMTNVVQLRSKRRGAVDEGGGDLAGLIRLYFQQIAADDAAPDETDEEGDAVEPPLSRLPWSA